MTAKVVLAKLTKDKFIRDNIIVFSGGMAASFLNYLFHPVLSRMMSVQDFGEVQALLSLYNNLILFLGMFGTVVINIIANTDPDDERAMRENMAVITVLKKVAVWISFALFLAVAALSFRLQEFFRFQSFWPFIALAPSVLISAWFGFRRAYLRGMLDFKATVLADILTSAARLLLAAFLVWLGLRSFGAIAGVVASMLVGFAYVYARSRSGFRYVQGVRVRLDERMKGELRFGLLILVVSLTTMALGTADVLVVKHFFPPTDAGLYGGVAIIARIVMYVTGSVTAVLLPSIKLRQTVDEHQTLLRKALAITLLLGGATLTLFTAAPRLVLKMLIGSKYAVAAGLLPPLGLLMLLVAVTNMFFSYHLALRQYFTAAVGAAGLALIFALSCLNHATLTAVICDFMIGTAAMLAVFIFRWLRLIWRRRLTVLAGQTAAPIRPSS